MSQTGAALPHLVSSCMWLWSERLSDGYAHHPVGPSIAGPYRTSRPGLGRTSPPPRKMLRHLGSKSRQTMRPFRYSASSAWALEQGRGRKGDRRAGLAARKSRHGREDRNYPAPGWWCVVNCARPYCGGPPEWQSGARDGAALGSPPHLAGWLANRREAIARGRLVYDIWPNRPVRAAPFTPIERRRLRILDTLFKALEAEKIVIAETDRHGPVARSGQDEIAFQLRPRLKEVRQLLTLEERRWHGSGKQYRRSTASASCGVILATGRLPILG